MIFVLLLAAVPVVICGVTGRLVAGFVLGGLVLLLGSALYLIILIVTLDPGLAGADRMAVSVLGTISLLAVGGIIVVAVKLLR